jgi:hypothetical protein
VQKKTLIILSFIITGVLLHPMVSFFSSLNDGTQITLELSEEENNQDEKKELGENEFFFHSILNSKVPLVKADSSCINFYIEISSSQSFYEINPPPERYC